MRESIGGTWTMQIVIVFILFFVAFITLTINYTRAFKVKNEVINIIEREEGFTYSGSQNMDDGAGARELIASYLTNNNYSATGRCPVGWVGVKSIAIADADVDTNYEVIDENNKRNKYYYCLDKIQVPIKDVANANLYNYNTRSYYKVRLFFKFSIPVFGDLTTFNVEGESNEVYFNWDHITMRKDDDYKPPQVTPIKCDPGYTAVDGVCADNTPPSKPKLELFRPVVNDTIASYCLKMSDSTDQISSVITYEVLIDGEWDTCAGGVCCYSLADANTNYRIEGRACDSSNNCANAQRVIMMNPKRLYIWQVYQYLRATNGDTIIGQPSDSEVSDNLASASMAQNVRGMYNSKEANNYFDNLGSTDAQAVVKNFYLGILGRNYDAAGLIANTNTYRAAGKDALIKVFVNSEEAQIRIYRKWGLGTGTV